MLTQWSDFLLKLILCLGVLSVERVFGLPLVFLALVLFFAATGNDWRRLVWVVAVGWTIAIVYGLPFLTAIVGVAVFLELWKSMVRIVKHDGGRLLLLSVAGGVLLSLTTHFYWTTWGIVSTLISFVVVVLLSTRVFSFKSPLAL